MYLPWPHLTQKFALDVASALQFERNIAIYNKEVRKESDHVSCFFSTTIARIVSVQELPSFVLPWAIDFAASYWPWAIWFCLSSWFGFAASFFVLLWTIWFCRELSLWFCRELFCVAVNLTFLVLPWAIWFCHEQFVIVVIGMDNRIIKPNLDLTEYFVKWSSDCDDWWKKVKIMSTPTLISSTFKRRLH
mgnify:CR=1 FL=1